jgi:hypothetical protein
MSPDRAALQLYTAHRLPKTTAIARRSSKAGALYHRPRLVRLAAARLLGLRQLRDPHSDDETDDGEDA